MKPPKILTEASIDRDETEHLGEADLGGPGREQRADDDHARDGVGDAINGEWRAGVTRQTT